MGLKKNISVSEQSTYLIESIKAFAIFSLDSEGVITSWNHGAEELFFYKADEIIGTKFSSLGQKAQKKTTSLEKWVEDTSHLNSVSIEGWKIRKDGSLFWANTVLSPLLNSEGKVLGFAVVISDITAKHKQEVDLLNTIKNYSSEKRKNDVFMEKLSESSVIAYTDAHGVFIEVNKLFCQSSGYERLEIIGKTPRIVNSGYHPKEFFKDMWDAILSGRIWVGEICNRRKDGSLFWVYGPIVPLIGENGHIERFFTIRQNITQKKDLESQLSISQKLLQDSLDWRRNILDSANQCMIATDSRGVVNIYNRAAEKFIGYSSEEVAGQMTPMTFFKSEEIILRAHQLAEKVGRKIEPGFDVITAQIDQSSGKFESDWLLVRKDGKTLPVTVSVTLLKNKNSQIQGYLILIQDRTEQKNLLKEISDLKQILSRRP